MTQITLRTIIDWLIKHPITQYHIKLEYAVAHDRLSSAINVIRKAVEILVTHKLQLDFKIRTF